MARLPHLNVLLSLVCALGLALACGDSGSSSGAPCALNSDCPQAESCVEGRCVPECREDRDCENGARCRASVCVGGADAGGDVADDGAPTDVGTGDAVADDAATDDAATDTGLDGRGDSGVDAPVEDASDAGDTPRPDGSGGISGQVHFRLYDDSILPVAEPVVYWTYPGRPPAPLAVGASCDCGYPSSAVIGDADGRFTLEGVPAGRVLLVVQKGEFRRVREIAVEADSTVAAPRALTELPVRDDPEAGDEIPNVAIGTGRFDPIEDVFAKLRMGPITSEFGFDYREYLADPEAWGVRLFWYHDPGEFDDDRLADITWSTAVEDYLALLGDWEALRAWDFIFSPCAATDRYRSALTSAAVRGNLQRYVNEGGKLYATDYSYDVIEQPFPEYVDFTNPAGEDTNADGAVGDQDRMSLATADSRRYASHSKAHPPLLRQWLLAVDSASDGFMETEGNWVNIRGVGAGEQCCRDGVPVAVTPEVVVSGPNFEDRGGFVGDGVFYDHWNEADAEDANHPHTLRFPYGCGEVMYSTYHTTEFFERNATLTPQELVLVWLILEINQCNLDPIKE